jgi:hypothetical protein
MSRGLQIRDMDAAGGQAGAGATSGSDKGKEKELLDGPAPKAHSQPPSSDAGASTEQPTPIEKKRRLIHKDGTSVGEPQLVGHQAPCRSAAGQVHGFDSVGLIGA